MAAPAEDARAVVDYRNMMSRHSPEKVPRRAANETVEEYLKRNRRTHAQICKSLKTVFDVKDHELPLFYFKRTTLKEAVANETIAKIFLLIAPAGDGKSFLYNQLCRSYEHYSGISEQAGVPLDVENPLAAQISETTVVVDTMGLFNRADAVKSKEMLETVLMNGKKFYLICLSKTNHGRYQAMPSVVIIQVLQMFKAMYKSPEHMVLFNQVPPEHLPDMQIDPLVKLKGFLDLYREDVGEIGHKCKAALTLYNEAYPTKDFRDMKQAPLFDCGLWATLHNEAQAIEYSPDKLQAFTSVSPVELARLAAEAENRIAQLRLDQEEELKRFKKELEEAKKTGGPTGMDAFLHGLGEGVGGFVRGIGQHVAAKHISRVLGY